jgi:hypothetical protein
VQNFKDVSRAIYVLFFVILFMRKKHQKNLLIKTRLNRGEQSSQITNHEQALKILNTIHAA